jgi:serine/threonine-protein kinase HipA
LFYPYYPELTRDMAMKIGGQYQCDRVTRTDFEQLATDVGLSKSLVNSRVTELAEAVHSKLQTITIDAPISHQLSEQIQNRCTRICTLQKSRVIMKKPSRGKGR